MLRIAHRGLWGPGVPENSLAAIEAAAKASLGLEFDVHLSKDGVPIVFHDANLERMTGEAGYIFEKTAEELQEINLIGDPSQSPPRLSHVLSLLAHRRPILIEVKTPHRDSPHDEVTTATAVLDVVKTTLPTACCMSFSAIMTDVFADALPTAQVGYLADKEDTAPVQKALDTGAGFAAVWRDDVASARDILGRDGPKLYTWTIKSEEQKDQVIPYVDGIIYEGF